jgi:formate dehydrogenase major subunit
VGAQTRRTPNVVWHAEDRLDIHPADAEDRGIRDHDWVGIQSRAGETVLRAHVTGRMQPGVVYTTFHFPESCANVVTTDSSDWATNCPEYKVTAVQVRKVNGPSEWQTRTAQFDAKQQALAEVVDHSAHAAPMVATLTGSTTAGESTRSTATTQTSVTAVTAK